jgi:hypothetical protein
VGVFILRTRPTDPAPAHPETIGEFAGEVVGIPAPERGAHEQVAVRVGIGVDRLRIDRLDLPHAEVGWRFAEATPDPLGVANVVCHADRLLAWMCGPHQRSHRSPDTASPISTGRDRP